MSVVEAELATRPIASPAEVAPGASFGRFVMVGVRGHGGMGVVIEAYDPELDRRLAIKLLNPHRDVNDGASDAGRARLQREAQAMARLAHPNAVTVYEVGRTADQLFIAMELVDGTTLGGWLARPRRWREIVAMFVAAGRGLEAAHRVGLVHRDFKPENVLIGDDGRPRVSDFGLAAYALGPVDPELGIAGTPAYMSPEQWRGDPIDARSDQFAFCAALWRAVWGEPPFAGAETARLRDAVLAGALQLAPRRIGPRWLERALARGLAVDPAARWPSLGALLDSLEARLRARRRAPWLAVAASAIAAAAIAVVVTAAARPAADPCQPPVARTAAVWSPARRALMQHHAQVADPALGARRFTALAPVFDRGIAAWTAEHGAACRATRVDGGQSDTLLDLRMRCLDGWLGRLDDLADDFERAADPAQLEAVIGGTSSVGLPERCADTALLQAVAPPPVDPAKVVEVSVLDTELAAIRTALHTGALTGLAGRSEAAVAEARRVGHPPALAEALDLRATLAQVLGDNPGSITRLRELIEVAARAHDDERIARTWAALLSLIGEFESRPDQAMAIIPAARAASARIGDPPLVLAQVLSEESRLLAATGNTPGALADLSRARQLLETAGARQPGSPAATLLVDLLQALGTTYLRANQFERANATLREAIALADATFGPDTVRSAAANMVLGQVLRNQGQLEAAEAALREAVRIREARTGQSAALASALGVLADTVSVREHHAEAIAIGERAIAIARSAMAPDDAMRLSILAAMADIYGAAHRTREALAVYDEVFELAARAKLDTVNRASWSINRADLLREAGRCPEAITAYRRAAEIGVRFEGKASHYQGSAARGEGLCLHDLKRDPEAIRALQHSLEFAVPLYLAADDKAARAVLHRLLVAAGRPDPTPAP